MREGRKNNEVDSTATDLDWRIRFPFPFVNWAVIRCGKEMCFTGVTKLAGSLKINFERRIFLKKKICDAKKNSLSLHCYRCACDK